MLGFAHTRQPHPVGKSLALGASDFKYSPCCISLSRTQTPTRHTEAQRQQRNRAASSSGASPAMTASSIVEEFYAVQQPASYNIRYSEALKAFARSAILAYECGYSEDMMQQELDGLDTHQGRDSTDCTVFLSLVWITIMLAPNKSIRRWTQGAPVSDATLAAWRGFVSMIVDGWFEKRWAWYPINRLQMELSVATGRVEKPSVVAEMARIVYTTLETVAPQFPSM
ncbi:hypothetical protein WJX84_001159 [Apatococcus fuscideae]|uniref:DUF7876 domain-containing protein n=1 Tax=Apatococcus fuscideae TaxID=2026836 RepID=A0AAW1T3X0_9CHLO